MRCRSPSDYFCGGPPGYPGGQVTLLMIDYEKVLEMDHSEPLLEEAFQNVGVPVMAVTW